MTFSTTRDIGQKVGNITKICLFSALTIIHLYINSAKSPLNRQAYKLADCKQLQLEAWTRFRYMDETYRRHVKLRILFVSFVKTVHENMALQKYTSCIGFFWFYFVLYMPYVRERSITCSLFCAQCLILLVHCMYICTCKHVVLSMYMFVLLLELKCWYKRVHMHFKKE